MSQWDELKRLAEICNDQKYLPTDFKTLFGAPLGWVGPKILAVIAENERLREEQDKAWRHAECNLENLGKALAELETCASVLPGTHYMDPPDGGDVSIPEQLRRMAKDAERYRFLREGVEFKVWDGLAASLPNEFDGIIDYELSKGVERG